MKSIRKISVVFALFMSGSVFAQERPIHEVYAMMMFNITKYVQWPDNSSGEFIIGVIGNGDVYNTLNAWYGGKPKGSQTYKIKSFKTAAEAENCSVVFIDRSKISEFENVKNKVKGKNTLIITDRNGFGERGSSINFTTIDNKLKFELNQRAIEAANLKVASSLTSMAILI
jgi:hypothetical protein